LPPLDGGRVLAGFLPQKAGYAFSRIEPFGLFIIIELLASGLLGKILVPPFIAMSGFISRLFGLHF
ncbi:MAG: site-2 protease family protein, partial [Gammaproteobacteria bacterium]